jgi:hypothetical protein
MTVTPPHVRFREARERIGLNEWDLALDSGVGVGSPAIYDIETYEGDLTCCYSPIEVQKFCRVLGIRPIELFADGISEPPISAEELIRLILAECRSRGVTLEQFGDVVGWELSGIDNMPPEKLLEALSIDGLQWLCRELRVDWLRVLLGL